MTSITTNDLNDIFIQEDHTITYEWLNNIDCSSKLEIRQKCDMKPITIYPIRTIPQYIITGKIKCAIAFLFYIHNPSLLRNWLWIFNPEKYILFA